MKKLMLVVLVIMFMVIQGFPQEAGVPEKVKVSLDALLKTRASNQVFNLRGIDSHFYVLQGAVYVNVLFSADLEADIAESKAKLEADQAVKMDEYNKFVENEQKKIDEANKKIREKNLNLPEAKKIPEKTWEKPAPPELILPQTFHNLFMRVVQDGKVIQHFKSPMPYSDEKTEYYSFPLILNPGQYDLLINVDRTDDAKDGTLLITLDVPKMTLADLVTPNKDILVSPATFYKKTVPIEQTENRFAVIKNCYDIAPCGQEYYPYTDATYRFKATETPTLAFFIMGFDQPAWNVTVDMEVQQDKKKVTTFKVANMENPYFFQPITFKKGEEPLAAGDYVMIISLTDANKKSRKAKLEIPFTIVD